VSKPLSADRLVFFTDAVVAIAITLLVLPLVDVVPEVAARHGDSLEVITENQPAIYSFVLSFVIIARLWFVHHRLFSHVQAHTRALAIWNMLWLLTIVTLPFPTEMIGRFSNDRFTACFYTGTILAGSLCQTIMVVLIRRNPAVTGTESPVDKHILFSASATAVALAVAFVVALIPGVGFYALLLLLVPPMVERVFTGMRTPRSAPDQ
jgi:uncharacterized membrane protein